LLNRPQFEGKRRPHRSSVADTGRRLQAAAERPTGVILRRTLPRPAHDGHAVIYRPTRSVMQPGLARSRNWVLEFKPRPPQRLDHLMGWCGSTDPLTHVRLSFSTAERAVAFAKPNRLSFVLRKPAIARPRRRPYADNFR
jgi:hypothetical protein